METGTRGNYLLILNASQRAKHAERNMFLYEQSPEQRVSTILLKGHKKCPHKDAVHYTHTHLNSNESTLKGTNAARLTKKAIHTLSQQGMCSLQNI